MPLFRIKPPTLVWLVLFHVSNLIHKCCIYVFISVFLLCVFVMSVSRPSMELRAIRVYSVLRLVFLVLVCAAIGYHWFWYWFGCSF